MLYQNAFKITIVIILEFRPVCGSKTMSAVVLAKITEQTF